MIAAEKKLCICLKLLDFCLLPVHSVAVEILKFGLRSNLEDIIQSLLRHLVKLLSKNRAAACEVATRRVLVSVSMSNVEPAMLLHHAVNDLVIG